MIAKCSLCNEVFSISMQAPTTSLIPRKPLMHSPPAGMTLSHDGEILLITRRIYSKRFVSLILSALATDGFIIYFNCFVTLRLPLLPGGLVLYAIGAGMTAIGIAMLANSMVIRISHTTVTVRIGPFPWPGNIDMNASDIDQPFCTKTFGPSSDDRQSNSYNIEVKMKNGARITLVSGIDYYIDALFIEQQVEQSIGITDCPVIGETQNEPLPC